MSFVFEFVRPKNIKIAQFYTFPLRANFGSFAALFFVKAQSTHSTTRRREHARIKTRVIWTENSWFPLFVHDQEHIKHIKQREKSPTNSEVMHVALASSAEPRAVVSSRCARCYSRQNAGRRKIVGEAGRTHNSRSSRRNRAGRDEDHVCSS